MLGLLVISQRRKLRRRSRPLWGPGSRDSWLGTPHRCAGGASPPATLSWSAGRGSVASRTAGPSPSTSPSTPGSLAVPASRLGSASTALPESQTQLLKLRLDSGFNLELSDKVDIIVGGEYVVHPAVQHFCETLVGDEPGRIE